LTRDGSGNRVYGTPTYLGRNAHGDVVWQADATGAITGTQAYDPFGTTLAGAGSISTTQAWQSSILDSATGLYYVIARWYSPSIGRFLSVDPVAGSDSSPQTLDRYAYGAGDSINRVDPDGRAAVCRYGAEDCGELAGAHHGTRTLADVQRDHPAASSNCGAYSGQAQQECEKARQQSATGVTGGSGTGQSCTYLGSGSQLYCVSGRYDGSQMVTTSTTTWGEWTSTTSTTTYGMTTSTTVSNTKDGITTTTTSNTSQAVAAGANQGCDPNPFAGNSCVAAATGAAVSGAATLGGATVGALGTAAGQGGCDNPICAIQNVTNIHTVGWCLPIISGAAGIAVLAGLGYGASVGACVVVTGKGDVAVLTTESGGFGGPFDFGLSGGVTTGPMFSSAQNPYQLSGPFDYGSVHVGVAELEGEGGVDKCGNPVQATYGGAGPSGGASAVRGKSTTQIWWSSGQPLGC
jgi:RHS repeat-associated protein